MHVDHVREPHSRRAHFPTQFLQPHLVHVAARLVGLRVALDAETLVLLLLVPCLNHLGGISRRRPSQTGRRTRRSDGRTRRHGSGRTRQHNPCVGPFVILRILGPRDSSSWQNTRSRTPLSCFSPPSAWARSSYPFPPCVSTRPNAFGTPDTQRYSHGTASTMARLDHIFASIISSRIRSTNPFPIFLGGHTCKLKPETRRISDQLHPENVATAIALARDTHPFEALLIHPPLSAKCTSLPPDGHADRHQRPRHICRLQPEAQDGRASLRIEFDGFAATNLPATSVPALLNS